MRTISILLLNFLFAYCGFAQTMTIHYKNGQNVKFNVESIDYIDFQEKGNDGGTTVSQGEAVDLGLSVLWASRNVGAESLEQYGNKYAWGETTPKEKYNRNNYLYYDAESESYVDIGTNIANTDYDVAHFLWGDNWRMPTYNELIELREKCIWEWTNVNGINGWKVIGTNGNSIFFPTGENSIYLWACDMDNKQMGGKYGMAHCICFSNTSYKYINSGDSRQSGNYVRPVFVYK